MVSGRGCKTCIGLLCLDLLSLVFTKKAYEVAFRFKLFSLQTKIVSASFVALFSGG
jgi:hypothetical protein